jgi:hypothetical protein
VEPESLEREPEEAVKRRSGGDPKQTPRPKPVEVSINDEDWKPEPRKERWQPCFSKGVGGGPSGDDMAKPTRISCTYQCGRYQVILRNLWGTSGRDCDQWKHLKRAEEEARSFDRLQAGGR